MADQTIPVEKLRALLAGEGSAADKIQAIYDEIQPPVPPLPEPLFLAKATHPDHGEGVVISHYPDVDGTVRFMVPEEAIGDGTSYRWMNPSTLTFHTPDHPEYLETEEEGSSLPVGTSLFSEEDYRSAPEGTIIAQDDERPAVLVDELWRHIGSVASFNHFDMAGIRRRVLRWGWEA